MRRWELERGLPIHRVPGSARGAVFAYTEELEEWLRRPQSSPTESDPRQPAPGPVLVPDLGADQSVRGCDGGSGEGVQPSGKPASETHRSRNHLLPWLAAAALAVAVFAGVYSYRQTARFAARAAGSRGGGKAVAHAPSPEVQDLYLRGRYYWSKRNPEDLTKAVDYFTQAIVEDPGYAPAFVGLADCYNLLREFGAMPAEEAFPRALTAAQKAVELDDSSAEAHNSLAFATFYWNWDAATAEREFKRALELNPNFVQGHHWYATFLLAIKRFPEALDQIEQARKLDPSSTSILADKGLILWDAGQHRDALALLQQVESADASLATIHAYLARVYFDQKDYKRSFPESKRAAELRKDAAALALAEAAARGFNADGPQGMWEAMLPLQEKMVAEGRGSAYELACTYAALGKSDAAARYLQSAFEKHEIAVFGLPSRQAFDQMRADPAYKELIAQLESRLPRAAR